MRNGRLEYVERIFDIAREPDERIRNTIALQVVKFIKPKINAYRMRFLDYGLLFFAGFVAAKIVENFK